MENTIWEVPFIVRDMVEIVERKDMFLDKAWYTGCSVLYLDTKSFEHNVASTSLWMTRPVES